jgi:cation diffusion facilitator CzcD-associated flavoprotein CzcO
VEENAAADSDEERVDVAVIGGGQGGIYASYRFAERGLSVIGIEGGSDFGGVWFHNQYPGSRVDTDSIDYCFHFSPEIFGKWRWNERFADAATLLAYLHFVAETLNVRRFFRFDTWLRRSQWSGADRRWHLETDRGDRIACRFLVMCTGNLSEPRPLSFPGLASFGGEWLQTSRWPRREVRLADRRIGVIGTGSSGAQVIPVVAEEARHLFVFQRQPHYSLPAQNRATEAGLQDSIHQDLAAERERLLTRHGIRGRGMPPPSRIMDLSPDEQIAMMEEQWQRGGHGMAFLFTDAGVDSGANSVVSDFVRTRIRSAVGDAAVAEKLVPKYPIGTRRLILGDDYYETFNRHNVTLVDVQTDPIVEITDTGVRTEQNHYEVDLLIFATGFQAFRGPLESAGIENEDGATVAELWSRGPRTLFGLMTPRLPNLFHPVNAGSPAVLGNAMLLHEFSADWIADCIAYMDARGYTSVDADESAADNWGRVVATYSEGTLRLQENSYMVHVNADDGSRVLMPFPGGSGPYVEAVREATGDDYRGFSFG